MISGRLSHKIGLQSIVLTQFGGGIRRTKVLIDSVYLLTICSFEKLIILLWDAQGILFQITKILSQRQKQYETRMPLQPPQGYSSYEIFRLPIIKSFYWVLLEVRRVVKPTGSREFRHHVLWSSRRL